MRKAARNNAWCAQNRSTATGTVFSTNDDLRRRYTASRKSGQLVDWIWGVGGKDLPLPPRLTVSGRELCLDPPVPIPLRTKAYGRPALRYNLVKTPPELVQPKKLTPVHLGRPPRVCFSLSRLNLRRAHAAESVKAGFFAGEVEGKTNYHSDAATAVVARSVPNARESSQNKPTLLTVGNLFLVIFQIEHTRWSPSVTTRLPHET